MHGSCHSKGQYMKTAILAVFLFLVMIFPHELGHFIAARKCGVQVNEFSFGMGPAIWKKQKGETLYAIRVFPIGGYCAMEGEDGQEDEEDSAGNIVPREYNPRAFNNKKPWQKIIILAAGSFMNVVCAFLILAILVTYLGFTTTTIGGVTSGSPAEAAGLLAGDKVTAINGEELKSWDQLSLSIQEGQGADLTLSVERGNENLELTLTPSFDEESQRYMIGTYSKVSHNPIKAVRAAFVGTYRLFGVMYDSLKMLITGGASLEDVSGPVGIVQMVGETSSQGLWSYGFLMALICVNLAVINMLPLPALDGGRILIVLFGWITKKSVSPKVEGIIHAVGMVLILGLAVLITFNDIGRLAG